jgi:O-antigen ligase
MLKAILYLGLAGFAIIGTFFNPVIGAVGCIEAYFMNPVVLSMPDGGFRYQLWTTVAFLLSCLVRWRPGLPRVGREGIVLKSMWIFVGIAMLSTLWAAVNPQLALDTSYEVFKTVLFATLLLRVVRTERDVSIVITACLVGGLHASALHVFGTRLGILPASMSRDVGVLPDFQGPTLMVIVPSLILLAMLGTKWQRVLCWLTLPVVLDSIVNTYQRADLVALIVEIAAVLLFLQRKIVFRLLPVLAVGLAIFMLRLTPDNYWEWMSTITHPTEEASANSRFTIADASWTMFMDYPVLGVGYRNYIEISPKYFKQEDLDPANGKRAGHNSFLTVMCETGIVGFSFWIFAFGGAAWLLRRIRKRADPANLTKVEVYAMGLEIGLYGWLVTGFFHNTHEVDPAYWIIGLAIALTRLRAQQALEEAPAEDVDEISAESPFTGLIAGEGIH